MAELPDLAEDQGDELLSDWVSAGEQAFQNYPIVIDPTLQEAEVTYEQGGQVQKATFTLGFPNVRGTPPAAGDTDRFRGATLDVGGFQRSGGVTR